MAPGRAGSDVDAGARPRRRGEDVYSGIRNSELQALLSQTAVGLALTDASGEFTMLSPSLQELFGRPVDLAAETVSEDQLEFYDERGEVRLPEGLLPLTRARKGEVVRDVVVCARVPGRGVVPFRCNAAPVHDADNEIEGAILLLQDISAEQAAVREREELRDRLVSTINHEFRTPLAVLMGRLELLEDASKDFDDHARYCLMAVVNAGHRLDTLVRRVSQLVDLQAHARLSSSETDLGRLTRMVVAGCASRAFTAGVDIVVETEGDVVARVDPAKVRSAITALLVNALVHAEGTPRIVARVRGGDSSVEVGIHDFGRGIPEGERERLVGPFETGADTEAPLISSGLGLALATTVADAHGGQLVLGDEKPHGLSAVLVLPRDAELAVGA